MGSIPLRSREAIFCESILSFFTFPPCIAFMYNAWPRTNSTPMRLHRSATQYQVKIHSTARTKSSR
jgi:hypothetical protein